MLFRINSTTESLEGVRSDWAPQELSLERYLITQADADVRIMSESVFGEPLLLVSNQVRTSTRKRADILAVDRAGNGVIIELKRNAGRLGVETQALQYLADFSRYRGHGFIEKFSKPFSELSKSALEEALCGFMEGKINIEEVNARSRVILVARSFDETIFSLGEWLSSKGVAFRCISYHPVQLGDTRLLSFSVVFDRSPEALYPLAFGSGAREPAVFWHNIARADQSWWEFLVAANQIPACFEGIPGDQGEKILTKYIPGDKIVAYATGYGAVGWGMVEKPNTYRLIPRNDAADKLCGECRHRVTIRWKATARKLADGLPSEEVKRDFGIYHPIRTSVSIRASDGERLIARLTERFGAAESAQSSR